MEELPPEIRERFRAWGRAGAKARKKSLTPEQRRAIAKKAGKASAKKRQRKTRKKRT